MIHLNHLRRVFDESEMSFPQTEQELRLEELFAELTTGFKELDKLKNVQKQEALLKELTEKIKDGKAYENDPPIEN